jgi:hypothetical protein
VEKLDLPPVSLVGDGRIPHGAFNPDDELLRPESEKQVTAMTRDQLLTFYTKLEEREKVLLLLELAHSLTVVARGTYGQGQVQDPMKLIKTNEFQHRLSRITANILRRKRIHTDKEVVEHLFEGFAELEAMYFVERVVDHWG